MSSLGKSYFDLLMPKRVRGRTSSQTPWHPVEISFLLQGIIGKGEMGSLQGIGKLLNKSFIIIKYFPSRRSPCHVGIFTWVISVLCEVIYLKNTVNHKYSCLNFLGFGKKSVFWESIFWQDKSL
jgi:hypothetical protein